MTVPCCGSVPFALFLYNESVKGISKREQETPHSSLFLILLLPFTLIRASAVHFITIKVQGKEKKWEKGTVMRLVVHFRSSSFTQLNHAFIIFN